MSGVSLVLPFRLAPIGVSIVGLAVLIGNGLMAWVLLRTVKCDPATRVAGMVLALSCYTTVFWTLRGMEVGLLSLLLIACLHVALRAGDEPSSSRDLMWLSIMSGLGVLTRNDAVLLFAPIVAWSAWKGGPRTWLPALGPMAVCVLVQIVFRYAYYHEFLPNTYVLKMTGVPASVRLTAGLRSVVDTLAPVSWAVLLVGLSAVAGTVAGPIRRLCAGVVVLFLIQAAYLVRIGGDAWVIDYSNRFVATVTPALLVAAAATIPAWVSSPRTRVVDVVLVSVNVLAVLALWRGGGLDLGPRSNWSIGLGWAGLILLTFPRMFRWRRPLWSSTLRTTAAIGCAFLAASAHGWVRWGIRNASAVSDDAVFARQGLMLRASVPQHTTVAAAWLGAPSYYSGLATIDLLGKVDKHIARLPGTLDFRPGHNKIDLDYSVGSLHPDLVLMDVDLGRLGYVRLPNGIWMRGDWPDREQVNSRISGAWCIRPGDSWYCPQDPAVY
jgi:hypothetical protein